MSDTKIENAQLRTAVLLLQAAVERCPIVASETKSLVAQAIARINGHLTTLAGFTVVLVHQNESETGAFVEGSFEKAPESAARDVARRFRRLSTARIMDVLVLPGQLTDLIGAGDELADELDGFADGSEAA